MVVLLLLSLIQVSALFAQDLEPIKAIQSKITQDTIDKAYAESKTSVPLEGDFLATLVPTEEACEDAPKKEVKEDEWKLLFVADVRSLKGEFKEGQGQTELINLSKNVDYNKGGTRTLEQLYQASFDNRADRMLRDGTIKIGTVITEQGPDGITFKILTPDGATFTTKDAKVAQSYMGQARFDDFRKTFVVSNQTALYSAISVYSYQQDTLKISEDKLVGNIADMAQKVYGDDENAKLRFLSDLSHDLYRNYNFNRLPGGNASGDKAVTGALSLNQMMNARVKVDNVKGGVCTDISAGMARLAEKMFKDKEIFVVNQGIHFGLMVTDGKTHKFVDGSAFFEQKNNLLLLKDQPQSLNLRMNRLKNGKLEQVAVLDSQLGEILSKTIDPSRMTLSAGLTPSTVSGMIESIKKEKKNSTVTKSYSVIAGDLDQAQFIAVVAKREKNFANGSRAILGMSLTNQNNPGGDYLKQSQQLAHHFSYEKPIIRYKSDDLDVHLSGQLGTQLGFTGSKYSDSYSANLFAISANAEAISKAGVNYHPKGSKLSSSLNISTQHVVGNKDWEDSVGKSSQFSASNLMSVMKNTSFNLN